MDKWNHNSLREYRHQTRRERDHHPSFSSSLLDEIYRSIDQASNAENLVTMKKKQCSTTAEFESKEDVANFRRASLIEKWMDKKTTTKITGTEKIMHHRKSRGNSSSSSNSDSSSGGGLFSSEAESNFGVSSKSSNSFSRPKPIRTSFSTQPETLYAHQQHEYVLQHQKYSKHDSGGGGGGGGGFVKTKSKALKIYGDLKKPISPGGRVAIFLNSLFTTSNAKKNKLSSSYQEEVASLERKSKSANASTCSSASSFSRSCLSQTPSSRRKLGTNGPKRSVRFNPVSVIVDEDCQPCGEKFIPAARNSVNDELRFQIREKNRRVEEAARDLLKDYHRKVECHQMDEDEDDDDAASCASSDLFELDNLSAIGIERYREELPVYETTYFDTNRAIAKGLIL